MGSIINTYGYIESYLVMVFNDLQSDGTILKIKSVLEPGETYRIMYYDKRDKSLYTINGRYVSYINNEYNEPRYIIIDVSTSQKSNNLRICIGDIKSIEAIDTL